MTLRLQATLAADGILSRRLHPALIGRIDAAVKRGELVPLLPGTYAQTATFEPLILAVADWDPDAVFTGSAAARLTWWPEVNDETVRAVTRRRPRRAVKGTALSQTPIAEDLIWLRRGLRVQNPAASTLDLARAIGPDAIDEALRRRVTTVTRLQEALFLMAGRPHNASLARWLRVSRDEAWSALEREAHAILRRARITGWKGNYFIRVKGRTYYADLAFPGARIAVELDGWRYHSDRASFVSDRRRDVALRLAGWTVLRFTAQSLEELVPALRKALHLAS